MFVILSKHLFMDYKNILHDIYQEIKPLLGQGKVANYIPALAEIDSKKFGISVSTINGETFYIIFENRKYQIESITEYDDLQAYILKCKSEASENFIQIHDGFVTSVMEVSDDTASS
jgi:glutaminase